MYGSEYCCSGETYAEIIKKLFARANEKFDRHSNGMPTVSFKHKRRTAASAANVKLNYKVIMFKCNIGYVTDLVTQSKIHD